MATKKEAVAVSTITTETQWKDAFQKPALYVVDVYSKWVGPCEAVQATFRRIKFENGEKVEFIAGLADGIEALEKYRNTSIPQFLFFMHKKLVGYVQGANAPLIEKMVKENIALVAQGVAPVSIEDEGSQPLSRPSPTRAASAKVLSNIYRKEELQQMEKTLAIIKPDAMQGPIIEQILEMIKMNRFDIVDIKKCWLTKQAAEEFYKEHRLAGFFNKLVNFLSSSPVIALVLAKEDAIKSFRSLMGPANPTRAKDEAPRSIRAQFGTDNMINAIYGADSAESFKTQSSFIFNSANQSIIDLEFDIDEIKNSDDQKTLLIIKPDIVRQAEKVDEILQKLLWRGMQILKREELVLSADEAERLYAESGTKEDVLYVSSGPILALVIKGENVVKEVKELVGPLDPEEARKSLPMSIRALHGEDRVHNAVDCSASVEECSQQVQVLFPGLGQRHSMNDLSASHASLVQKPQTERPSLQDSQKQHNPAEKSQKTLALIKPDAYSAGKKNEIIARINEEGFTVVQEKELKMTITQASKFYAEHEGKGFYQDLTSWMSSAPLYAMVLEKADGIAAWRKIAGPTNSIKAREESPKSIRALFGTDGSQNAVHGSDSESSAEREISIIFVEKFEDLAQDSVQDTKLEETAKQETVGQPDPEVMQVPETQPEPEVMQVPETQPEPVEQPEPEVVPVPETQPEPVEQIQTQVSVPSDSEKVEPKIAPAKSSSINNLQKGSATPQKGASRPVSGGSAKASPGLKTPGSGSKADLSTKTPLGSKSDLSKKTPSGSKADLIKKSTQSLKSNSDKKSVTGSTVKLSQSKSPSKSLLAQESPSKSASKGPSRTVSKTSLKDASAQP